MQFIAIAVRVLTVVRHLNIVVRAEEPAKYRVVQATVHIDDVELAEHLMSRVALV